MLLNHSITSIRCAYHHDDGFEDADASFLELDVVDPARYSKAAKAGRSFEKSLVLVQKEEEESMRSVFA